MYYQLNKLKMDILMKPEACTTTESAHEKQVVIDSAVT